MYVCVCVYVVCVWVFMCEKIFLMLSHFSLTFSPAPALFSSGGDQSCIHAVLGLKKCTSLFACVTCFVHKHHRGFYSDSQTAFDSFSSNISSSTYARYFFDPTNITSELRENLKATLKLYYCQAEQGVGEKKKDSDPHLGQEYPPLLLFDVEDIVWDELHCLPRVTDTLITLLLRLAKSLTADKVENFTEEKLLRVLREVSGVNSLNIVEDKGKFYLSFFFVYLSLVFIFLFEFVFLLTPPQSIHVFSFFFSIIYYFSPPHW